MSRLNGLLATVTNSEETFAAALPEGAELISITGAGRATRMEWWTCNDRRFMIRRDKFGVVEVWHAIEPSPDEEYRKAFLEILCQPQSDSKQS